MGIPRRRLPRPLRGTTSPAGTRSRNVSTRRSHSGSLRGRRSGRRRVEAISRLGPESRPPAVPGGRPPSFRAATHRSAGRASRPRACVGGRLGRPRCRCGAARRYGAGCRGSRRVPPRHPSPRTGSSGAQRRTVVHSAHVGATAVVQYPYHPLHGRVCRVVKLEQGSLGLSVSLEDERGLVQKLPTWMLDPVFCRQMEPGAPRVSLPALAELSRLLIVLGLRRSPRGGEKAAREEIDEEGESVQVDRESATASVAAGSKAVGGVEPPTTAGGASSVGGAAPGVGGSGRDGGGR